MMQTQKKADGDPVIMRDVFIDLRRFFQGIPESLICISACLYLYECMHVRTYVWYYGQIAKRPLHKGLFFVSRSANHQT